MCVLFVFFFKQKTAYEMRISDWSSDVCSSDLAIPPAGRAAATPRRRDRRRWSRSPRRRSRREWFPWFLSLMRSEQLVGIGLVVDAEPLDHRGAGSVEPNNFDRGAFAPEADHRLIQHAHARDVPEVRITQIGRAHV